MTTKQKMIFLIAGEPSGDTRGAELIRALKSIDPEIQCEGLGGPQMEKAGMKLIYPLASLAAIGLGDVLKKYFQIRKIFHAALAHVTSRKPDAIILIDYPGFNLRFAKKINNRLPIFYYISPQIWAWGRRRIHIIRRFVRRMVVLFRFEEELYRKEQIPVTWVGHPLANTKFSDKSKNELKKEFGLDENEKTIALLPGSRETEVRRILPAILNAAELIKKEYKKVNFLLAESENVSRTIFDDIIKSLDKSSLAVHRVTNRHHDMLSASDFAIVTSGTATLETALAEIPFVILYKTAWSTYFLGKQLIRIPYIGLVNIVAGKKVINEFIQNDANPKAIASEILSLMRQPDRCQQIVADLKEVKNRLGSPGAPERAAQAIINSLNNPI